MTKKTKLGIIGAGEFGNFAVKIMDLLPGFQLIAVADTNEQSAENLAKRYGAKVYSNYTELIKNKDVDIVMINTPNHLHAKMVIDCIKFHKKVLCEKPLGINEKELQNVLRSMKENKGVVLVNFLLPRSSIYKNLGELIQKKIYGQLKYVNIINLATESTIKSKWYWDKKKSGGWFLTADIHFYDLIVRLINKTPHSFGAREYTKNGKTEAIYSEMVFEDTVVNIFHDFCAGYERADFESRFIFEKAEIQITGWIPVKMTIIDSKSSKEIIERNDREKVYQKLVAENLQDLSSLGHKDSMDQLRKVITSSEIAFALQKTSDVQNKRRS